MTGPEPDDDVTGRLLEGVDRVAQAAADLRQLIEQMRTALEEGGRHARTK